MRETHLKKKNYERNVLVIMYSSKPYITDSIVAKAFVAWKAVKFDKYMGIQNIILDSDALKNCTRELWKKEQS